MPKLIVSIDGIVVKEVQLTQDRSTLGRRPYNDIVIDNLAVSGEHAVLQMADGQVTLEDLGSTNGTCVNGQAVQSHVLANDDVIEIGKYRIRFLHGEASARSLGDAAAEPRVAPAVLAAGSRPNQPDAAGGPRVRVVTGSSAGREMLLTKAVTTLGKPGVAVAAITRKPHGFDLAHVKGQYVASVNGVGTDAGPITLVDFRAILTPVFHPRLTPPVGAQPGYASVDKSTVDAFGSPFSMTSGRAVLGRLF